RHACGAWEPAGLGNWNTLRTRSANRSFPIKCPQSDTWGDILPHTLSGWPKRVPLRGSLVLDHEMPRHRVLQDGFLTHVLAEPAALHAAVRRLAGDRQVVVHPGHAHIEPVRDTDGARHVTRPDRGGEPVAGVVGQPHALVLAVEGQDHEHRAEKFALNDLALLCDIRHKRGRV